MRGFEHFGTLLLQGGLGLGQTHAEAVDDGFLAVVGVLIFGLQPGGFPNIDLALDDAVVGFFGEAAKNQPAAVDHFALGGGHGEELETRVVVPEIEEGVEVFGHIAGTEEGGGRVRRIEVDQGGGRRGQAGW